MHTIIMTGVLLLGVTGVVSPEMPGVDTAMQTVLQRGSQGQGESQRLDVNKATVKQLQKIAGIGPALAQRIVDFRTEHGPFEKVDDLLNVRGIGTTTLDKLKPFLMIGKK